MAFEITDKDLLARIGKLETKSGTIETPLLLPVVNPNVQMISPNRFREEFHCEALITNAYILKKRFQDQPIEMGLQKFLGFNGVIMTDSGAYQILVYGDIEITPDEIVEYQEAINSDIATILDWPTGWKTSKSQAESTVKVTLRRAENLFKIKTRDDVLWVGPVQGGRYLDLVAQSAVAMRDFPFQIYALGSPTRVMENYRFDLLVDMIMTAKRNLPLEKPLHLFGAGHPFMFALAVALGCDLFDSAAYARFAKEERYMTEYGTFRLKNLDYFPCSCPKCTHMTPKEIGQISEQERRKFLAEHNLFVSVAELKRIKQAIKEGRLWELLEIRAHSHPALLQALKRLKQYEKIIEKFSAATKKSGIFFFGSAGLARPEVVRHREKLKTRFLKPKKAEILLLIPQTRKKPFHTSKRYKVVEKLLKKNLGEQRNQVHICFYAAPFGIIPLELDEVYPLSQHETVLPLDQETVQYVVSEIEGYINRMSYDRVVLLHDPQNWDEMIWKACQKRSAKQSIHFQYVNFNEKQSFQNLFKELKSTVVNDSL